MNTLKRSSDNEMPLMLYAIFSYIDYKITIHGISLGLSEANPVAKYFLDRGFLLPFKLLCFMLIYWAYQKDDTKKMYYAMWVGCIMQILVVVWNISLISINA